MHMKTIPTYICNSHTRSCLEGQQKKWISTPQVETRVGSMCSYVYRHRTHVYVYTHTCMSTHTQHGARKNEYRSRFQGLWYRTGARWCGHMYIITIPTYIYTLQGRGALVWAYVCQHHTHVYIYTHTTLGICISTPYPHIYVHIYMYTHTTWCLAKRKEKWILRSLV